MTSRPAPMSIAENTARQRSEITANTSGPQKSKPPFQTNQKDSTSSLRICDNVMGIFPNNSCLPKRPPSMVRSLS